MPSRDERKNMMCGSMNRKLAAMTVPFMLHFAAHAMGAGDQHGEATPPILSAFYGLDDSAAPPINALCTQSPPGSLTGQDGMPIVFADLIDPMTIDASDFRVHTASGSTLTPACATINPANEPGEERTVLLVGELGSAETDPPVRVSIVGTLQTQDGVDLNGSTSGGVVPLMAGPALVLAEVLRPLPDEAPPGTTLALRATWEGGVSNPDGGEITEEQWSQYRLEVRDASGRMRQVAPSGIGDLGDNDNNHELFFDEVDVSARDAPHALTFPAGLFADPNGDLNRATTFEFTVREHDVEPRPCGAADLVEPFGVLDASDLAAAIERMLKADETLDIAEPRGELDALDLLAYVQAFKDGC